MSADRRVSCDMCGARKPKDYKDYKGWAYVSIDGSDIVSQDFCPKCWGPLSKIMLRSFVDDLMKPVLEKT